MMPGRSSCWRVAAVALLALLPCLTQAFDVQLVSSKVSDELKLTLSPPQPNVSLLKLDAVIDTTGKAIATNVQLTGDGSTFVAPLTGDLKLPAGLYKMKVSAKNEETKETVKEVFQLKVTVPVEAVSADINGLKLKYGGKIAPREFSSGSGDGLQVSVKLQHKVDKTPVVAHQAFLRFTHVQSQTNTYFVLDTDKSKTTHSALVHFASLSKRFAYKSGEHKLQLILGDPTFESSLTWDLGSIDLLLAAEPPVEHSPLYTKPLLHESDTTLKALPEIKHVMRLDDPRPPLVVSLAFTAAVLVPFVAFLGFVLHLRLNVSKLFDSSVFVFGSGFMGSLAAILALFGFYWLELTMFRTLGYLAVLGFVNVGFGHLTLKRLASSSSSAPKKAKHD